MPLDGYTMRKDEAKPLLHVPVSPGWIFWKVFQEKLSLVVVDERWCVLRLEQTRLDFCTTRSQWVTVLPT